MEKQFEIGKTYATRSACDHNCIIRVAIVSRTKKTVKTADGKTFRVAIYDNAEFIRPWGNYSMAPIVNANDAQ